MYRGNRLSSFNTVEFSKNKGGDKPGFERLRRLWLDSNELSFVVLNKVPKLEELYLQDNYV